METTMMGYLGLYGDIGEENGNYCGGLLRAYIGMMETKIYYNGLFGVV